MTPVPTSTNNANPVASEAPANDPMQVPTSTTQLPTEALQLAAKVSACSVYAVV